MKEDFKVASVFIGTIIGAGLASGQEILQFFSLYGTKGFYGILICCFLYIFFTSIIVRLCFRYKFHSYKEAVDFVLGKRTGFFIDLFLTFFIFGSNTIMISGGGAMLHEYANVDKAWGIFIMAGLTFLAAVFSTKGVVAVNSIIVPLSTITILIMGILVFINIPSPYNFQISMAAAPSVKKNWILSAVLYSSFNLMSATGVLSPMISESRSGKHYIRGTILGSLVLIGLMLIINSSILIYAPGSFKSEIPNLYISKKFGNLIPFILTAVIWLEMFSTDVGDLYSLSNRIHHSFKIPYITSLLIIMLFSIPAAFIGFSNLIKLLYPPYGAVSLIFLAGSIIKFLGTNRNKA